MKSAAHKPHPRYVVPVEGDPIRDNVLANLRKEIDRLPPGTAWAVEIKRDRKPRTTASNAYLWGVCYPHVVRALGFNAEAWHEEMCIRFFGKIESRRPDGGIDVRPLRTTTTDERGNRDVLTGQPFWQFVEFLRRQASEGGVYVPEPNERERAEIIEEWSKAA
jgi:hypothetical protein